MASRLSIQCLLLVLAISSLNFPEFTVAAVRRLKSWDLIREVNKRGPYVGLITVYQTEEKAFFDSGAFEADPKQPIVVLSGEVICL